MARSQIDNTRFPPGVPAIRYVEVYSIDSNPSQPVSVKLLKWDGTSSYVTYGNQFRIGLPSTKYTFKTGYRLWIIWRSDSKHWEPLADVENYRLIRGQSYGVQSGPFILLNNIVVLAGGLDPTNGVPAAFVRVANIFSSAYTNGQFVDAAYSPRISTLPPCDWETIGGGSTGQSFTIIQGLCVANVAPEATSFAINHIELLGGSLDPRAIPGSPTETLTITKTQFEAFIAGTQVTAVYLSAINAWQVIEVERCRALRGKFVSDGGSTIEIDHIIALDSGVDPRLDPTSDTETLDITKVASDTFSVGEDVWADYNAKTGKWESRPKAGGNLRKGRVKSAIAGATSRLAAGWTSGEVYLQDPSTGILDTIATAVKNDWIGITWVTDAQVTVDMSKSPPRIDNGTCAAVSWSA